MLHIALYQPEIPPNTGNIIRLCANTGATLHLVHPLGFTLDARALRRAGLDYHELAELREYDSLEALFTHSGVRRWFACSTHGRLRHDRPAYRAGDGFLLGPETRGLPPAVRADPRLAGVLRLPMRAGSRSLNLANAAAVVLYEAWRQLDFAGADQNSAR